MQLSDYYQRISFSPITLSQYQAARKQHATHSSVHEFERLYDLYFKFGDRVSAQPYYRFLYSTPMPGLNILWWEVFAAMQSGLNEQTFPEIARFCGEASRVLDAGCGDGLLLCYVALQNPNTEFIGIDLTAEAIDLCRQRIAHLGLKNVAMVQADTFQLGSEYNQSFDRVILRNVIDDIRVRGSAWEEASFETTPKMHGIKQLLRNNAQVWVGLASEPQDARSLENRVFQDFERAGFTGHSARQRDYIIAGEELTYLIWNINIDNGKNNNSYTDKKWWQFWR